MKLPNNELSIITNEKILDYLLNETHKDGKSKAKFFKSYGFNKQNIDVFRISLIKHAIDNNILNTDNIKQGKLYIIVGNIKTPNGRNPRILAVWIIKHGENKPRLVTAYPYNN